MARTYEEMSDRGKQMLDDLPPFYSGSTAMVGAIDALALELYRIEAVAVAVREQAFPQNADDTYGILGLMEHMFGLPVEPTGISLADRRANVIASMRGRIVESGDEWINALETIVGSSYQAFVGPHAYDITILTPYDPTAFRPSQVARLARRITPAPIHIITGLEDGFLLGISELGDAL